MHDNPFKTLTRAQFLQRHWQKKPLLIRNSLPEFGDLLTRHTLFELAQSPEAESRLVMRTAGRWQVRHGPFRRRDLARLPARDWTLLVQGVDLLLPRARDLLSRFSFIPYARLDDLMVSYAPPGGGVGPHFDSYDVFLLQISGQRRWQTSSQRDLALVDDAPLKILRRFRATQDWTLDAGDMLYLPPQYAHDGVAINECITASVGFRAPSAQDLCSRFLDFRQDNLQAHGRYADPGLRPTTHPARIAPQLANGLVRLLEQARWTREDMLRFIGEDLSTPKAHVVYKPPGRPLSAAGFTRAAQRRGLRLAPGAILLYDAHAFYISGERHTSPAAARNLIRRFADRRTLPSGVKLPAAAAETLYAWYRAGYAELAPG